MMLVKGVFLMGIIDEHCFKNMMLNFMTVADTEWVTGLLNRADYDLLWGNKQKSLNNCVKFNYKQVTL